MGKKSRTAVLDKPAVTGDVPVVGLREPCPCGSGKRYKQCHGRAAKAEAAKLVTRPFEGLTGECDWVAMREIVPAATATVTLTQEYGGREVTIVTLLPMAWPAIHRADGAVLAALQTQGGSGDPSRDVAAAILRALETEAGQPVPEAGLPGPGPRLQDILEAQPFEVQMQTGFEFWFDDPDGLDEAAKASLQQANDTAMPSRRLRSVEAAYWVDVNGRRHLRWVLPDDETQVLDGIARLHAAGGSGIVEGSRYVGSFRADGVVVPVWDVDATTEADDLEEPMAAFEKKLRTAMKKTTPLTDAERRAKAGMLNRQLTLR
ncbi:DUF5926 family protein [Spongisporangium articulatum]|uniref:DUF5926 family protein n=1 Tax=Spongisporangium articulatum TaxID=3362603 RepID=A0ABW8AKH0_9ACTN